MNKFICAITVLSFGLPNPAVANDAGPDSAFFNDVRAGRAVGQLPPGMPDPAKLSQRFNAEPRVVDWATRAEAELDRALERVDGQAVKWRKVTCNRGTCEVMVVFRAPTAAREQAISAGVQRQMQSIAVMYNKEMSLAIGGDVAGELAVLTYLFDDNG